MTRALSTGTAGWFVALTLVSVACDADSTSSEPSGGQASSGAASGKSSAGNGGAPAGTGGAPASTGGAPASTGGTPASGATAGIGPLGCEDPNLVWKSANKTNYESYPDPGSEECIEFNGCTWEGQFAACDGKKPEQWVEAHNIAAAFPDFQALELHDLCLRKGTKTIVVTVLDTCGDSDCDGCCTQNRGSADQLIDLEHYTNERWGVPDGRIEWADLGPTRGTGCSD
jgi:hypothetical protein